MRRRRWRDLGPDLLRVLQGIMETPFITDITADHEKGCGCRACTFFAQALDLIERAHADDPGWPPPAKGEPVECSAEAAARSERFLAELAEDHQA